MPREQAAWVLEVPVKSRRRRAGPRPEFRVRRRAAAVLRVTGWPPHCGGVQGSEFAGEAAELASRGLEFGVLGSAF
jgi:hypothetical protein